jgi:hypothetical protein
MNNAERQRFTLWPVAKARSRKPQLKAFGSWLIALRGRRTRQQISDKLSNLGVPLGGATLAQYEAGTVWAPDPGVLWGLSEIYRRPLTLLIRALRENRADTEIEKWSDLPCHSLDQRSAPGGVVHETSVGVLEELTRQFEEYKVRVRPLLDASRLAGQLAAGLEADTPQGETPRRRGHR